MTDFRVFSNPGGASIKIDKVSKMGNRSNRIIPGLVDRFVALVEDCHFVFVGVKNRRRDLTLVVHDVSTGRFLDMVKLNQNLLDWLSIFSGNIGCLVCVHQGRVSGGR
jgi:hypothetical protein